MTPRYPRFRRGFTMLELMFVCGIIALIATMILPSILSIFNAGADAQAYNILASQVAAARAVAIKNGTFAALHVQQGEDASLHGACYAAVMTLDPNNQTFYLANGYAPVPMPGGIVFGEVGSACVDNAGNYIAIGLTDPNFRAFTFVFTPQGELTRRVDSRAIQFDVGDPIFAAGSAHLWSYALATSKTPTIGATCCTMFQWGQYNAILNSPSGNLATWFNENAVFLPVNVQTGQLFPRR